MDLTFLTPMAAMFAVSALLPLGIYWFRERARGTDPRRARPRRAVASLTSAARRVHRRSSAVARDRSRAAGARHGALGAGADRCRSVLRGRHVALDARGRRPRERHALRPGCRGDLGDSRSHPAGSLGHRLHDRPPAAPRPAHDRPAGVRGHAPALDRRGAAATCLHVLDLRDVLRHPRRHSAAPLLLENGEEARARRADRRRVAAIRRRPRARVPREASDPDRARPLRQHRRAHLLDG